MFAQNKNKFTEQNIMNNIKQTVMLSPDESAITLKKIMLEKKLFLKERHIARHYIISLK